MCLFLFVILHTRTVLLTTVYDEFPVDHQNGINKPNIRLILLLKCNKTN